MSGGCLCPPSRGETGFRREQDPELTRLILLHRTHRRSVYTGYITLMDRAISSTPVQKKIRCMSHPSGEFRSYCYPRIRAMYPSLLLSHRLQLLRKPGTKNEAGFLQSL